MYNRATAGMSEDDITNQFLPGFSYQRTGDTSGDTTFTVPGYYYTGAPSVIQDQGQALDAYGQALQAALARPRYQAPEIAFGNSGMNGGL
jgi:hypothetical protein